MIFYNRIICQYWWIFHQDFLIPLFLEPTDVVLWYFKLDQIVVCLKYQRFSPSLRLIRYKDEKIWVCGKNSVPLINFREKFYLGWKGHVLIYHVEEFLKRTGKPLGIYTEQCSEAVHANFKKTYKRYACNEAFEGHGEKLRKAVSSYSSMRI